MQVVIFDVAAIASPTWQVSGESAGTPALPLAEKKGCDPLTGQCAVPRRVCQMERDDPANLRKLKLK
jgi:hypothetical protein